MTPIQCPNCGRIFESMNAYNGHLAHCKVGNKGVNGGGERELGSISEIMELLEELSKRGKVKAQGGMKLTFELGVDDLLGFLGQQQVGQKKEQEGQEQEQGLIREENQEGQRWDWRDILIAVGLIFLGLDGANRIFGGKEECRVGGVRCWQVGAVSLGIAIFGLKKVRELKGVVDLMKSLKGL